MQQAWYAFVKFWVKLAIKLFYRRIEIHGYDTYPMSGPVMLAPNHQSAFMDALIPAVFAPRPIHFLVRADVFENKIASWFFHSLNMMPVYRQRDGISNLSKNEEVFEKCAEILRNDGTLLIFPEAGHQGVRRLRTLSKGFTRIVFEAVEPPFQDLNIQIVPLGINYSNYQDSQSRLIVSFGEPLSVGEYVAMKEENPAKAMSALRLEVQNRLEREIIHIEREDAERAFDIELDRIWPFFLNRSHGYSQSFTSEHSFYKNREESVQKIPQDDIYFKRIFIYDHEMRRFRLRAPFFFIKQKDPGYWVIQTILLVLFSPVFVLSWIVHAPGYFLIRAVLYRFVKDKQFHSSIKLLGGLVLLPLFMLVYLFVAITLTGKVMWSSIAILAFFPLSIFIIRELRLPYRYWFTMWRMTFLKWVKPYLYKYLIKIEEEVISTLT